MDIAVGTDIVAVERIAALIRRRGPLFAQRWFTRDEMRYCECIRLSLSHCEEYAVATAVYLRPS